MSHGTALIFRAKTSHGVTASYGGPASVVIPRVQEREPLLAAPQMLMTAMKKHKVQETVSGRLLLPSVFRKRHLKRVLALGAEDNFL